MMHTELYCKTLDAVDPAKSIRAVHEAWLQLHAIGARAEVNGTTYDNARSLASLAAILHDAGHAGF